MASPLTPIGLVPWGGQIVKTSIENTFTWQSGGTQAAYYVQWARNVTGAVVNNSGWVTSSIGSYLLVANSFVNTHEYKWRVKIRNSTGLESAYSDYAVFKAGNPDILTITFPASDMDTVTTLPTYQHAFNSPTGSTQYSYRYRVYTAATWDTIDALTAAQQEALTYDGLELYDATLVWDSGVLTGTATSIEQPSGFLIPGEYWYKVRCTVVDSAGNSYSSDLRTYYILLNSVPKTPTITVVADPVNGQNVITIINPIPDAGQVGANYNRLYRKRIDGTWELIQDNISGQGITLKSLVMQPQYSYASNGYGYDATCRSGKSEEYSATAIGTNYIESGKSTSAYATCQLTSYWFTNTDTNTTVKLQLDPKWGQMQSEREREEYQGMDEVYPSVCYGARRFWRGNFQALVMRPTDGTRWPDYVETIRAVMDSDSPAIMRSPWGDLYELDISDLKITPYDRSDQARNISYNMVEVDELVSADAFVYDAPTSQLSGYWVLDPVTNRGMRLWINQQWDGMTSERERSEQIGLNGEFPSIAYGNKKAMRGGFSGWLMPVDGELLYESVMKLRALVDAKEKKPLVFQAMSGDRMLVDIYGFNFELADRLNQARKVSFEFLEIGVI